LIRLVDGGRKHEEKATGKNALNDFYGVGMVPAVI
jgi:hypothetical protein